MFLFISGSLFYSFLKPHPVGTELRFAYGDDAISDDVLVVLLFSEDKKAIKLPTRNDKIIEIIIFFAIFFAPF